MVKRYKCGNQKAYVGSTRQWSKDTNVVIRSVSRKYKTVVKRYKCGNQKPYVESTRQWSKDTNVVIRSRK